MASMVAKACSSTSSQMPALTVQERGSRNKRKFRADPPLADPNRTIPVPQNECTSFEISADKFEAIPNHGHTNACNMYCMNQDSSDALKLDLGLSCTVGASEVGSSQPREEMEASMNEFHDADWSDLTESQLEELLLSNLDMIFKSAIKKIVASGYGEEVASKAILRSGLWYGCKDTVSNIVENALAFLRSGQEIDPSREHYFEDLEQMEKYILAELVCLLREVRPFFSTGDAMWCLLICDMNVSHACAMDTDPLGSCTGDATSNGNSSISAQPQLRTEPRSLESNISVPCKPNASVAYALKCPPEASNLATNQGEDSLQSEVPNLTDGPNMNLKNSVVLDRLASGEECNNCTSNIKEKSFSAAGISHTNTEEKFVGSRKLSGIAKREYILRQKSIHFERQYRAHGSKSTSRAGKLSGFSGLVLDKNLKAVAESTGLNAKNSFKIGKAVSFDVPQKDVDYNISTSSGLVSVPTSGMETNNGSSLPVVPVNSSPSLPVADTELSLSFPAKGIANPMPISYSDEAANCSFVDSSNDKSLGQWVSQDRKDEMAMKMVSRVRELQNQLQEWTEWANQKVMQAARRLSKDKAELKTLRQEKEEVERLKKEKQTLEESTMKKLSEMENALCKASGQVERANAAVGRLQVENAALRREMEAAKLRAAESAASCHEVSKREKMTLIKFQSWEKQKTLFQEDLAAEKRKLRHLQLKLQQAKDAQYQAEVRLNQEEKAKDELLTQASSFRKEREQIEASAKSEEDMIKSRAENYLLKYKDDIEKLEKDISQLRLKTDSSKIAALRRGIDGSYASKVTDSRNIRALNDSAMSYISRAVAPTDLKDLTGNGGVKRERECVMCLSEEMSVVFLPCAHQVVCTMCNELHEKQGMKDCPSCRSPIQRRVCVRYHS
ncbi:putative E3 ubiquitin-protein ligase RF298 [Sesamum indicum]|uniref:E3 ubiquitin-protein ligase RF298 n=1 Tax=Sesamum indicum TaxID=4182 RepID=A0A6I9SND6_SESIN|nr:putative E3 ubiquitin-protein ligase RF298 [Sesamum indicum]